MQAVDETQIDAKAKVKKIFRFHEIIVSTLNLKQVFFEKKKIAKTSTDYLYILEIVIDPLFFGQKNYKGLLFYR